MIDTDIDVTFLPNYNNMDLARLYVVRIRPLCDARRRCDAQRHDAQRRDARQPSHPDDDDTPDVKRKRRLEGLALAVCFIPKSQTCNSYKINPFR